MRLRGWEPAEHHSRLAALVAGFGVADADLERLLARLDADPEAYFLSAEAHEVWRGSVPYDDYPMRRICSIHLVRALG